MDRLALEFISGLGMPPELYVELAARLGLTQIGFSPKPITSNPHNFPTFDLGNDPALLRDTKAALLANGVKTSLGEGFLIMPGVEIADSSANMDAMAELGAPIVNAVMMEADRPRAYEQFSRYAEMAAQRGMLATLEFMPFMWPINVNEAAMFISETGASNARLLIDAMHFFRSGSQVADLANIDPAMIGYVQVCDVPMPAINPDYGAEARDNRLPLGEGDLPLAAFIAALPTDVTIGLELPHVALAEAGVGVEHSLTPSIAKARSMIA